MRFNESKPLVNEEVEINTPQTGEILVKLHAAGLCHSDLSVIDGNRPRQKMKVEENFPVKKIVIQVKN